MSQHEDDLAVEAIAGAIASMIPLDDGSHWRAGFVPKWPQDYSSSERLLRYAVARVALAKAQAHLLSETAA